MMMQTAEGLTFAPAGGDVNRTGLTAADFEAFARATGATPAHARAIFEVESAGHGFTRHRGAVVPVILFEAHKFYANTKAYPVSRVAPHLSSRTWNRALYNRTARRVQPGENVQHVRLEEAVALDAHFNAGGFIRNAALMSCSWGLGQVLGENWQPLRYPSLQAFINAMFASESAQFDAIARFTVANGLSDELRAAGRTAASWVPYVSRYNGPAFRQNNYHVRAASSYIRHGGR